METKEEILNEYIDTDKDNGYQNGMWKTILEAMQAYKDQSERVPISERLPEDGQVVLCFGVGKLPSMATYSDTVFVRYIDSIESDRYITIYYDKVTAWQPLPKMPER